MCPIGYMEYDLCCFCMCEVMSSCVFTVAKRATVYYVEELRRSQ